MPTSDDGRNPVWDAGLQAERTSLAWTRTALAILVAVLVFARIAMPAAPMVAATALAVCLPCAMGVLVATARRYRLTAARLRSQLPLPDGRLPAVLALVTAGVGVAEVAHLLSG